MAHLLSLRCSVTPSRPTGRWPIRERQLEILGGRCACGMWATAVNEVTIYQVESSALILE
jgi:hypothetical protein